MDKRPDEPLDELRGVARRERELRESEPGLVPKRTSKEIENSFTNDQAFVRCFCEVQLSCALQEVRNSVCRA